MNSFEMPKEDISRYNVVSRMLSKKNWFSKCKNQLSSANWLWHNKDIFLIGFDILKSKLLIEKNFAKIT
jgi:hypothetical protein